MAVDSREGGDAPEEVDGAADHSRAEDQKANHPAISAVAAVDQVAGHLPTGLDDQQATEPFRELEHGRGVAEHLIPSSNEETLQQSFLPEYPILDARTRLHDFRGIVPHPPHPARSLLRPAIHAELIQTPDQEAGDDDGLQAGEQIDGPSSPVGSAGGEQAQAGEEEVVAREREAEGEAACAAADVEGEGDGEDDAGEEGGGGQHAEDHACLRFVMCWWW